MLSVKRRPRLLSITASASGAAGISESFNAPDQQSETPLKQPNDSPLERFKAWWTVESPKDLQQAAVSGEEAGSNSTAAAPSDLKPILARLWTLCRPDSLLMVVAVFHMLVAAAAELMIP